MSIPDDGKKGLELRKKPVKWYKWSLALYGKSKFNKKRASFY
jgi:hypothetical protein